MLSIDSIEKGLVIDHIKAGKSMTIYQSLNLGELDCSVAIIKNVKSNRLGKKDIIKIEDRIDLDLDILGYIDPNITINIIEGGRIMAKERLSLPKRISHIARCKNPRCITSTEQGVEHVFILTDPEKRVYRCMYCEQEL